MLRAPHAPVPAQVEAPSVAAESYRELVDLDGAHSVRWAKPRESLLSVEPDRLDIEILALVAGMRHVLSSQIHRRFNPDRATTTTQRRLKRLSDAGWVRRLQFHRRDGGGTPMCYVIAEAGLELLCARERIDVSRVEGAGGPAAEEQRLRQARHDAHVSGWALALRQTLGASVPSGTVVRLRGPAESVLSPPLRSTPDGRTALGPSELRLPGGRTPHEFLSTNDSGRRREVEQFETVRPDATIEVSGVDVLVELDGRLPIGRGAAKLERYDHLLAGWSVSTKRYGLRSAAIPVAVFVCGDRARARDCARRADRVLTACRAYAGEYPADWEYPGRAGVLFAAERDIHEGQLLAYAVPRLPPEVRIAVAHGDPRAREPEVRAVSIVPSPTMGDSKGRL